MHLEHLACPSGLPDVLQTHATATFHDSRKKAENASGLSLACLSSSGASLEVKIRQARFLVTIGSL